MKYKKKKLKLKFILSQQKLEKSEDDVPSTHGDDDTHLSEEAKTAMAIEVTQEVPKKTPKAKRKTITVNIKTIATKLYVHINVNCLSKTNLFLLFFQPDDPVETFETMQAAYEHCQQVVESLKVSKNQQNLP